MVVEVNDFVNCKRQADTLLEYHIVVVDDKSM